MKLIDIKTTKAMRLLAVAIGLVLVSACTQNNSTMKIESASFGQNGELDNAQVFNSFGCTGENKSPQLSWSGAPEGTKSFVITAYDPDAPTGSGWWHWTVFNLPATVSAVAENASADKALPASAIEGRTDFAANGFGGACPPEGDKAHRYQFTVFALGVDALPIDSNAPGAMVGYFANANALDKATITAYFGRPQAD